MENILSDRINNLSESATLAMAGLCRELKSQGLDVIDLSLGEPDFNTPDIVKNAGKDAIDKNFTFYTPVSGYLDLRKAICKKLKRDNDLDYAPDQIVVSNGAKQSIANAVLCLVNPGDEVIVPAPYWVSYSEIIKLAEGVPVYIEAKIDTDFKVTPKQIEAAITPKTKAFLFSSPCNPTGSVYSKEELKNLADIFAKHKNIYIISDEIYEHINFSGKHESIAQFGLIKDNVIVINGVSKGFAMTGWRIGYLAAPKFIAKACDKLQGQFTSAPSSIAQKAALMAMDADLSVVDKMVLVFKERRDIVLNLIKEIPGLKTNTPEGAFYVYPEVSHYIGKSDGKTSIRNEDDLCMYILKTVQVALVPGSAFGSPNYIRISYATSNDLLIEALKRIKKALSDLK
jgi:aspartate aminotransferase